MSQAATVAYTDLPFPLFRRGKVRDVYDIGAYLLFVTSDRVSAFDHILPTTIPKKGIILNTISEFWFKKTDHIIRNHLLTATIADFPKELLPYTQTLEGRSMVVIKTNPIDVECVVRQYLAGSAWAEYTQTGSVCGVSLPPGLRMGERLPNPIFTPAIKNHKGHDENISFDRMIDILGESTATAMKSASISLFNFASDWVAPRGLILADTKFEFGWLNNTLILIDEALTPDSSRYWESSRYVVGETPPSFDKQIVRNYLLSVWKEPDPIPALPDTIVNLVSEKYREGYQKITGDK
ncbi:phosphoribosylaminoimidazolesuccinocarboxamide synthase [bacterium]|nr:phosphoribosylaminoimidazolesuccinocarboxamide synthase [bacterium]